MKLLKTLTLVGLAAALGMGAAWADEEGHHGGQGKGAEAHGKHHGEHEGKERKCRHEGQERGRHHGEGKHQGPQAKGQFERH